MAQRSTEKLHFGAHRAAGYRWLWWHLREDKQKIKRSGLKCQIRAITLWFKKGQKIKFG